MIISHSHEFIFVKTGKTAGTSIEVLLSSVCGENDIFTPFSQPEPDHAPRNYKGWFNPLPDLLTKYKLHKNYSTKYLFRELAMISIQLMNKTKFFHHIPCWQIKNRIGDSVWKNYYKFCVERTPYEKVASGWKWFNYKFQKNISVDQYLEFLIKNSKFRDHGVGIFPYNFPNYTDPFSQQIMVDKIIRYENLQEEMQSVMDLLHININLSKMPKSKTLSSSPGSSADYHFSERQKQIIEDIFANEFHLMDSKLCSKTKSSKK